MNQQPSWLSNKLARTHPATFSTYCILAAFGTYFCMYAFRKPFTAATYEDTIWLGIGFKTILVAAQVAGYTASKFIGIKVVSEMPPGYRAISILGLIGIAEVALLLFAITPVPWNFIWLFANGLPLGMVFGLVLSFLEGRQVTETLSAGLCASFIVSSGVVKSVGRSLILDYGISTYWMPFLTGMIFVIPLIISVWLLAQIPPPSESDEVQRTKRMPMNRQQRVALFRRHAVGLIGLLTIYSLLTIIRSLRDDFAVEIWQELGVRNEPDVFARSEFWVMISVILINGLAIFLRNNRTAFLSSIGLIGLGFTIIFAAIFGQNSGELSAMSFMILLGVGMYIPYVAFHTTVFERMLAAFRETGTIAYLMYLADSVGYLVYVGMMVFRNTVTGDVSFLPLLIRTTVIVSCLSLAITVFLSVYYHRRVPRTGDGNRDEQKDVPPQHASVQRVPFKIEGRTVE